MIMPVQWAVMAKGIFVERCGDIENEKTRKEENCKEKDFERQGIKDSFD